MAKTIQFLKEDINTPTEERKIEVIETQTTNQRDIISLKSLDAAIQQYQNEIGMCNQEIARIEALKTEILVALNLGGTT